MTVLAFEWACDRPSRRRSLGWGALALALLLGCGDAGPENLITSDSHVIPAGALNTPADITAELEIEIHGGEGFENVIDAAVGPSGDLYVLDSFEPHVSRYATDGALRSSWGRAGEGPAELGRPRLLAIGDDTVFVAARRGIELFRSDGDYLGSVSSSREDPLWARVLALTPTQEGLVVITRNLRPFYEARDSLAVRRLDLRTGTFGAPLVQVPRREMFQVSPALYFPRMMALEPQIGIARDGTIFTVEGPTFRIRVTSPATNEISWIVGDVPRVPASNEDIESILHERARDIQLRDVELTGGEPPPRYRPSLGVTLVSSAGDIVAERPDLRDTWVGSSDPFFFNLITVEGLTGAFELDRGVELLSFGGCSLLGVKEDSLGVESIVRYQLRDSAGTSPCSDSGA